VNEIVLDKTCTLDIQGFDIIATYCRNLHKIEILAINSDRTVTEDHLLPLGRIKTLEKILVEYVAISDKLLELLGTNCANLSVVMATSWMNGVSDKGVKALVNGCCKLSIFRLWGSFSITDASFEAIAKCCPRLAQLGLHGKVDMTEQGLNSLCLGCPALIGLSVDAGPISEAGFVNFSRLTNLHNFSLGYSTPDKLIKYVAQAKELRRIEGVCTDQGLQNLADGCPKLNCLDLVGKITDLGCQYLVKLKFLTSVALREVQITDEGLIALAKNCAYMRSLVILSDKSKTYVCDFSDTAFSH
jgi:F-box/leucine-rich repeat protein 2/20